MDVRSIIETLEKQAAVYEHLLALAKEKTPYLVHNKVDLLNATIQKERKLLKTADELELQRMTLSSHYFSSLGMLRYKGGKISDMIKTVTSPQDKSRLNELHQQLTRALDELQKVGRLNKQLIEQSLKFINYSVDLLVEDPNGDYTYQHPRSNGYGNVRTGLFNTKG
ncbi:flagellar protein FlgN [Paenibacillus rhizovicinus]|uniref:Flagellar protein FlgN n=1 Tax=Paenibacillus rhizovicinus TaxID=2704463 RepID=A0A6C0P217_9BACL|nr:flagellar protein FlgN [Paenibacillus rhizovicinus]QHW32590.1 flagellar protein FlgN [Paenibacillus rhizovicinus]